VGGYYVGSTIHEDSNSFRKFEAYAAIFYDRFGYYLPIISTEGGPIAGDNQDPRYPIVNDDDVTRLTLRAYHAMLDDTPEYYFAFTPWLMANHAGGHWDIAWEKAAWYKLDGSHLPVVDALKADPRRYEVRTVTPTNPPTVSISTTQPETSSSPASPSTPAMAALTTEIIPVAGKGPGWQVVESRWVQSNSRYGRIYVNILDAAGTPTTDKQVRVEWSNGWTLLLADPRVSTGLSLPLRSADDVYQVSIAGGSGQAVRARGLAGYDLNVTFRANQ
jgi:hypothetical protein